MGSDLRRSTLPRLDQGEPCGGELAHALSEESSITADSSTSVVYGDADSSVVQSIGWTDEKHNLYLDLLERSFVDQLNHSKRMRGSLVQEDLEGPYPSMQLPLENCASSDEFKVLQDGCWQKINFQTQRMRNTSDYHVTKSSWMRHSIPGGNAYPLQSHASLKQGTEKVHSAGKQTFSCGLASTSMRQCAHHIRHPNSVGAAAEGTDQNFVDEDGKQNSAYSPEAKRVKRSSANGSLNDQVVPSGEFHRIYTSACGKYASSEEHQGHPEFLPNDPD